MTEFKARVTEFILSNGVQTLNDEVQSSGNGVQTLDTERLVATGVHRSGGDRRGIVEREG